MPLSKQIVLLSLLSILGSAKAWACQCAPSSKSISEKLPNHFAGVDLVLRGYAVDVQPRLSTLDRLLRFLIPSMGDDSDYPRDVTLDVREVFKGGKVDQVILFAVRGHCAFGDFRVGVEYVVFASWRQGVLTPEMCSLTAEAKESGDLLAGLRNKATAVER